MKNILGRLAVSNINSTGKPKVYPFNVWLHERRIQLLINHMHDI